MGSLARSTLVLALAGTAAFPAGAAAQVPAGATFSGGGVGTAGTFAGSSDVGLAVDPDGAQVRVHAVAVIPCGRRGSSEVHGVASLPVAADGTFSGRLPRGAQLSKPGYRTRLDVTGALTPSGATGTFAVRARERGRRACSGEVAWRAIPAPQLGTDPAPAPAGAVLLGRTSSTAGGPFSFNLRVSRDGRSVSRSFFSLTRGCKNLRAPEETNYNPVMRIRADGTFSSTQRFTARYTDATERNLVRVKGRFVAGGATGTFRWTAVSRNPKTGRVNDRCDSRLIRWSAAP